MKLSTRAPLRMAATVLTLAFTLAGCGVHTAAPDTVAPTEEPQVPDYSHVPNMDLSSMFDERGYLIDVTAKAYITLPDNYTDLTLSAASAEVSEAQVKSLIQQDYIAYIAEYVPDLKSTAKISDYVNIDFVGSIDGVEFAGGNSGGRGYDIQLGSHSFIDDFEEQIAGHVPGDTFDVEVTFPENYGNEDLNGKDAVFVTTLNYVWPDTLTDEMVQEYFTEDTGFTNAEEVYANARYYLQFNQQANEVFNILLDTVEAPTDYPQAVLDYYTDLTLYQYHLTAADYGMDLESFLQAAAGMTTAQYAAAIQNNIRNQAFQTLLMQAIAEDMGYTYDRTEMLGDLQQFYHSNDLDAYTQQFGENYLRMRFMENTVMERLIAGATIEGAEGAAE